MDTHAYLAQTNHLSTDARPSLESLLSQSTLDITVSNEGILTAIQDFITGSKKGEGRLAKDHDPSKHSKMAKLVRETYSNPAWMNKQVFKMGTISADAIIPYLTDKKDFANFDPLAHLEKTETYMRTNMANWKKSIEAYHRHFGPLIKKIKARGEYDTQDYDAVYKAIQDAGRVSSFAIGAPKAYEPAGRKFVYDARDNIGIARNPDVKGELPVVSKDVAIKLVNAILKNLDADVEGWKAAVKAANALYDDVVTDKLIKVVKNGDSRWVKIAHWFDPQDIMLSFQAFPSVSFANDQGLFAACRWIDRSIK